MTKSVLPLILRDAIPADVSDIVTMIHELAAFEQLQHECHANEADIAKWLFGERPKAYAMMALWDNKPAGFALYFTNFSTFLARPGLYIEDIFVRPEFRRRGIARSLFKALAQKADREGYGRMEWWVLNWNADAIRFYETLGAKAMNGWTVQRMDAQAIARLASV